MKYIITERQLKNLISESDESKSGDEVFPKGKESYHITPDIFLNKIQQVGLIPKSESKLSYHPERIYLFMNPEMDKQMTNILWDATSKEKKDRIKDYYVLKIDLTQIPNHKFYMDHDTMRSFVAIFTLQPIPSSAIQVIKKIPISELKPRTTPEETKREKEESLKWLSQHQNTETNSSDSDWDDIMKKLEKLDNKDLNISLDPNLNENISRFRGLLTEDSKLNSVLDKLFIDRYGSLLVKDERDEYVIFWDGRTFSEKGIPFELNSAGTLWVNDYSFLKKVKNLFGLKPMEANELFKNYFEDRYGVEVKRISSEGGYNLPGDDLDYGDPWLDNED